MKLLNNLTKILSLITKFIKDTKLPYPIEGFTIWASYAGMAFSGAMLMSFQILSPVGYLYYGTIFLVSTSPHIYNLARKFGIERLSVDQRKLLLMVKDAISNETFNCISSYHIDKKLIYENYLFESNGIRIVIGFRKIYSETFVVIEDGLNKYYSDHLKSPTLIQVCSKAIDSLNQKNIDSYNNKAKSVLDKSYGKVALKNMMNTTFNK